MTLTEAHEAREAARERFERATDRMAESAAAHELAETKAKRAHEAAVEAAIRAETGEGTRQEATDAHKAAEKARAALQQTAGDAKIKRAAFERLEARYREAIDAHKAAYGKEAQALIQQAAADLTGSLDALVSAIDAVREIERECVRVTGTHPYGKPLAPEALLFLRSQPGGSISATIPGARTLEDLRAELHSLSQRNAA